ncbi:MULTISPECIES: Gldg family protein [Butyricimonas]|uniref:Gldg family protein n=1 Tax=Butyricimonas TaxID=574697 RepID=UPI001D07B21C|nr:MULTISPECIES: Gldg family protein [Butyricimonas]MCB6974359.1 Gldg family protein [Butyricimonas synergistica]MCG4521081.1 Gldg family protein [Butyricimonas sp. DFI.6.44]
MKKIYKIAQAELQMLFYSPVAWLILVVFAFQAAMAFMGPATNYVINQQFGLRESGLTYTLLAGNYGVLSTMQGYLYFYIPLLTMGLLSREIGSGSIKLLYSSPVSNWQIILGKYLSMMIYGLALMSVLLVIAVFGACTIKDFDFPAVLTGILGLYLLLCAYTAVGLFMSSLTSYQVVVAVLTLLMLGVLNYVRNWWQGIEFVRDITYWLSISGRADTFIGGLICSEDVLYFIIVSALFLSWTVIRLQANRQKSSWMTTWSKYVGVLFLVSFLGFLSSRPILMRYYDATATKMNTLTPNSQEIISKLEGGLTITTYANALDMENSWLGRPESVKYNEQVFRQYLRFKPEIKMKYIYYYDTVYSPRLDQMYPSLNTRERLIKISEMLDLDSNLYITPEKIRAQIDLRPEGNKFVRLLERENGEKTFLRVFNDMYREPGETEITAALKRLVMKLPKVGFLTGHGERDINQVGDRGYNFAWFKSARYALINQGFDIAEVNLDREISADIDILVVAEVRHEMDDTQKENLEKYIARGGNLFILSEPKREEYMGPLLAKFGVQMVPGELVQVAENYLPNLVLSYATKDAQEMIYHFKPQRGRMIITTPGVAGLEYQEDKGYKVIPLFMTDSLTWNELETTDFVDDTVRVNSEIGEVQKCYVTALALTREVGDKEQKIMIFGDADCISNVELSTNRVNVSNRNFSIIMGGFYWLSDKEVPIDVRRPALTDDFINLGKESLSVWKIILVWVLPGLLVVMSLLLWIRRRGR